MSLTSGLVHTCGLTAPGNAFCWGNDLNGQLGNNTDLANAAVPAAVDMTALSGERFVSIAAGGFHTCGLTASGNAFCWGDDDHGQLGNDASLADKPTPVPVDMSTLSGDRFVSIVAGGFHTCGLIASGAAWC